MDTFMKFMQKKAVLIREEMAQSANPQAGAQPAAQDAPPEQVAAQPEQGAQQPTEDSGVSPPAHDEPFATLLSAMKEALPSLKPENKKLVSNFIKLASGESEDSAKQPESKPAEQPPSSPQAPGLGDQQGQGAPQPPAQPGAVPSVPQQPQ